MANQIAFYEATIKLADEKINEFYDLCKRYRAANPVAKRVRLLSKTMRQWPSSICCWAATMSLERVLQLVVELVLLWLLQRVLHEPAFKMLAC